MTIGFSANLGFLWTDRPLAEAIRAAARAGFDAVECHFPDPAEAPRIRHALAETGLPMLSLNTRPGDRAAGDFGLAALPGRRAEAEAAIRDAVELAHAIGARRVHVMAGRAEESEAARETFLANLRLAAQAAARHAIGILIEPINRRDVPGYYLARTDQAAAIVEALDLPNLRMMFDCYHVQVAEGDVTRRLERLLPLIGHVQIAGVPDRAEPDAGDLNYPAVLAALTRLGYQGFVGAEYRPRGSVEDGLAWLEAARTAVGAGTRGKAVTRP